jgi:hypothetical protein
MKKRKKKNMINKSTGRSGENQKAKRNKRIRWGGGRRGKTKSEASAVIENHENGYAIKRMTDKAAKGRSADEGHLEPLLTTFDQSREGMERSD